MAWFNKNQVTCQKGEFECHRCHTILTATNFVEKAKSCDNKKCVCRSQGGRERIAFITDASPEDFLPAVTGELVVHKEPVVTYTPTYTRYGQDEDEYWRTMGWC